MLEKCSECPYKSNTVKVYGEGCITQGSQLVAVKEHRQYDIVNVGMAPAQEELVGRRPFIGASGQILRRTLYQMGIKEYYVTNVLQCPIPDGEPNDVINSARDCCKERLLEEIISQHPRLTIALGDLPLHTLADTDYTISEIQGRVIPSKVGPLLPITHPAYYWRRPLDFFDFIECMRPGIRFLENKYFQAEDPTLVEVTPKNLNEVLNLLDKHEELAIDTETTGFFAHGWEPNEIMEMGISGDHNTAYVVPKELIPEFKQLVEKKKTLFWNAQFDCGFLKQMGINPKPYFDGMLAHYTIDERPYSHGLKEVAKRYLGCDNWEKNIEQYLGGKHNKSVSYSVIPTEVRHEYLAKDVTRTFYLREALEPDINKKVFWDMLMPACRMFVEIEHKGMRIDPVKMMDMDNILDKELSKMEDKMMEQTGQDDYFNPASFPQASHYIYDVLKLPVDPHFGFSTSKLAMDSYRSAYPIIDMMLDYREIKKLRGGYIGQFAKFVDKDFRVHPSIKLFGAVTGRLSSENPSIMNIKSLKELKRIFLPDYGDVLITSDVKQNELRWYYIYSKDEVLGKILRSTPTKEEPRCNDPHYMVSRVAYGEENADKMRTAAKAVVFGRLYKRSVEDIERQVGHEVIYKLIETVDGLFPKIGQFSRDTMKTIRSQGYLESYFGRRRKFMLITPQTVHEVERQGVNFPMQSAGSDLMLMNMLHLWEIKDKWGIFPFWPYHDSITMNAHDKGVLPEVKKELEEYSLDLVKGEIPFLWDLTWGQNYAMDQGDEYRR